MLAENYLHRFSVLLSSLLKSWLSILALHMTKHPAINEPWQRTDHPISFSRHHVVKLKQHQHDTCWIHSIFMLHVSYANSSSAEAYGIITFNVTRASDFKWSWSEAQDYLLTITQFFQMKSRFVHPVLVF